jgi:NADPH-dependent curcumin reductase CurA
MLNRQWLIDGQPRGRALLESDFRQQSVELAPLEADQVRIGVEVLGFDPSMKGQMENIGYAAATHQGDVMGANGIGEVVESNDPRLTTGDKVIGPLGWQEYATLRARDVQPVPNNDLLRARLGPLGGTGLTAYFGLLNHGRPQAGDTLVVSGAAGATGSIVGQLGRLAGCRVVGIAGGEKKCRWLVDELRFDDAIDYKNESVKLRLKELCPDGVDVFFDNVGGSILNDVLARIALNARVVVCGGISRYEAEDLPPGPANYMNLVFKRATMAGFLVTDYASQFPRALGRLEAWLRSGELLHKEDLQEGFDNIPATLLRLFSGQNFGKQILQL